MCYGNSATFSLNCFEGNVLKVIYNLSTNIAYDFTSKIPIYC